MEYPLSASSFAFSKITLPSFLIETILVWICLTSTSTVWLPADITIIKCSGISESKNSTLQQSRSKSSLARLFPASSTFSSTSIPAAGSPATLPSMQAAAIPVIPPEFGIVTHRTFFIMFPEHLAINLSGSHPSASLPLAAAYASAMGSVQPMAGTSSSLMILINSSCSVFSNITLPASRFYHDILYFDSFRTSSLLHIVTCFGRYCNSPPS